MTENGSTAEPIVSIWGRLSILLVGSLVVIGFASVVPVLPQISAHFSDTPGADTVIRAMVTTLGGAMAIGAPLGGYLAERHGERRVLLWALLAFALAGGAGMIIDNVWLLLVSRMIVGAALATTGVTAIALIAACVENEVRDRWIGFSAMSSNLATLLFMPLAAVLGTFGWRMVFSLHLWALVIFILIFTLVPEPNRRPAGEPKPRPAAAGFPVSMVLLGLCCGIGGAAMPPFIPFFFRDIGYPDPGNTALAIMALTLSAAGLSAIYGWVRRYLDPAQVFIAGFLIFAASMVFIILGRTVVTTLSGMLGVGLAMGLVGPNLFSVAASSRPEHRARRIGWARGSYFGSALLAQIPLEPITAFYGPGGAFAAMAATAILVAAVIFLLRGRLAAPPAQVP